MLARHATKMRDASETEDGGSSPLRAPGFAYEQFDETFEASPENRSPIRMPDRLSEIHDDDEEEGRKTDSDRSSFLDEIRFKFN